MIEIEELVITLHLFILSQIITVKAKSDPPPEEGDKSVPQQEAPEATPPAPEQVR